MAKVIGRDSSPQEVAALQLALSQAGFNPGEIDGKFGRKTEAAVRAFQRANQKIYGLVVDGDAGPQTVNALISNATFKGNQPRARPQTVTMPGVSARVNANATLPMQALPAGMAMNPIQIGPGAAQGSSMVDRTLPMQASPAGMALSPPRTYPGSIGGRYAGPPETIVPAGRWQSTEGMGLGMRPEVPRPNNVAKGLHERYGGFEGRRGISPIADTRGASRVPPPRPGSPPPSKPDWGGLREDQVIPFIRSLLKKYPRTRGA